MGTCMHTCTHTRGHTHLHGRPAQQPLLRPVLAMMWELGVVTVVTALGVLQLQNRWALDWQGWPGCRCGCGLLAHLRPGWLDGPLGRHWGLRAGRALGLPLAPVPTSGLAFGGGRAGEGAEPGCGAEEGRGCLFAWTLATLGLWGFGKGDAGLWAGCGLLS